MANGIKLYSTFTSAVLRHLAILLLHPDDYTVLLYITQHSPTQTGTTAMATPLECGNTGYSFIHQVILHLRLGKTSVIINSYTLQLHVSDNTC